MDLGLENVNWDDVEEMREGGTYTVLPGGLYMLSTTEVAYKSNSADTGKIMNTTFTVQKGEMEGKSFMESFNLIHTKSDQAQKIGREHWKAYCAACGLAPQNDGVRVMHKPFVAVVVVDPPRKGKNGKQYGPSNSVRKYLTIADSKAYAEKNPEVLEYKPVPEWKPDDEGSSKGDGLADMAAGGGGAPAAAPGGEADGEMPWD